MAANATSRPAIRIGHWAIHQRYATSDECPSAEPMRFSIEHTTLQVDHAQAELLQIRRGEPAHH